jgi:hypothetical protein
MDEPLWPASCPKSSSFTPNFPPWGQSHLRLPFIPWAPSNHVIRRWIQHDHRRADVLLTPLPRGSSGKVRYCLIWNEGGCIPLKQPSLFTESNEGGRGIAERGREAPGSAGRDGLAYLGTPPPTPSDSVEKLFIFRGLWRNSGVNSWGCWV